MQRANDNTFLIAAGVTLAAIVLGSSNSNTAPGAAFVPKSVSTGPIKFITSHYPTALQAQKFFPKVPWQLFLTFSGLESEFGKHAPQWNFFGTKPGLNYKGKKQLLTTHEIFNTKSGHSFPEIISITDSVTHPGKYDWKVKDYFRAFDTPLEAFKDFGSFVSHGCYAHALDLPTINEKLAGIKKCGYATDPDYVNKQMKLVKLVEETVRRYVK